MATTSSKASLRERARYAMDNALSKGLLRVLAWFVVVTAAFITAIALFMWVLHIGPHDEGVPFIEDVWLSLTRSLDPGTFGQDEGGRFRISGLIVTIGGLLALAVLIGLVSSAIDRRLNDLRRGRSVVVETGHVLILGYSSKLPIVIQELFESHGTSDPVSIVILTRVDKVELEEQLRREVSVPRGSRVIVRRGDPAVLSDLEQVRPREASSTIILRPDENAADARVVRVVLALRKVRDGLPEIAVVAELNDPAVAKALREALPGGVITVVSPEVIARITAQSARDSGLGTIYEELLDFEGDEIYVVPAPAAAIGRSFGEAILLSDGSTLIGMQDVHGMSHLCPPFDRLINSGESLILIAADETSIRFRHECPAWSDEGLEIELVAPMRQQTLLVGWNDIALRAAEEFDHLVQEGSELDILIDPAAPEGFDIERLAGLRNQSIRVFEGSTIDQETIATALDRGPYDHVLVLCPHEGLNPTEADARALLTVLHVRNYLDRARADFPGRSTNVITEILQPEAVDLAWVARPDDFIVSQRLVSLLLTQLAESPDRKAVLQELLGSHGTQVVLHPIERYATPGTHTYADLIEITRHYGLVLIGWQKRGHAAINGYLSSGIRINPRKDEASHLVSGDRLVLLSKVR